MGRLSQAVTNTGTFRREDFLHDLNGNRTSVTRRTNATDPAPAETDSYTRTAGTNRLASVAKPSGTRSITYDARGNTASETRPASVSVATTYDGYARLTGYTRTGDPNQTNGYNGLDDRVLVTSGTTTRRYLYDPDGRVLGEYGASASDVKAEFIWALPEVGNDNQPFGGDDGIAGYAPLAVAANDNAGGTVLTWVHANHLGVPLLTTSASGTPITPTGYDLPGFPGQSRTFADLYYNRYRDYDPTTGRYVQADPIGLGGGGNVYLYAMANPVTGIDPLGLEIRNLFPFEETQMQSAADRQYKSLSPKIRDGMIHIFAHASSSVLCVHSKSGPTCLTPKQFAGWLQQNRVNPHKPIMLWACSTAAGDNSFAQNLSKLLDGRIVVGATTNTRWNTGWKGTGIGATRGYVGLERGGEWRQFGGRK